MSAWRSARLLVSNSDINAPAHRGNEWFIYTHLARLGRLGWLGWLGLQAAYSNQVIEGLTVHLPPPISTRCSPASTRVRKALPAAFLSANSLDVYRAGLILRSRSASTGASAE